MTASSPYHSMSLPHRQTPSAVSEDHEISEKNAIVLAAIEREENQKTYFDPDTEAAEAPERPFLLYHACVVGIAMVLVVFVEMLCVSVVYISFPKEKCTMVAWLINFFHTADHRIPMGQRGDSIRAGELLIPRCYTNGVVSRLSADN
jgi:hypothetical protein